MLDEGCDLWRLVLPLYEGKTDRKIAQDLGVSRQTVFKHRRRLGIAPVPGSKPVRLKTDMEWQQIFLTNKGKSYREIANMFGCHMVTVQNAWRRLNQSRKPRPNEVKHDG